MLKKVLKKDWPTLKFTIQLQDLTIDPLRSAFFVYPNFIHCGCLSMSYDTDRHSFHSAFIPPNLVLCYPNTSGSCTSYAGS